MREGMTVFGSKELTTSRVLDDLSLIESKSGYNQLENPEDLIKIALFDLWVNNMDRGRSFEPDPGNNYNLLISAKNGKERIVAFDHAFAFGGVNPVGNLFPNSSLDIANKLYTTPYFRSVVRYMDQSQLDYIIDNFIPLLRYDYSDSISQTIALLPPQWELLSNLKQLMTDFLASDQRINQIEAVIRNSKS